MWSKQHESAPGKSAGIARRRHEPESCGVRATKQLKAVLGTQRGFSIVKGLSECMYICMYVKLYILPLSFPQHSVMLQRRREGMKPDMPTAREREEMLASLGGKPY